MRSLYLALALVLAACGTPKQPSEQAAKSDPAPISTERISGAATAPLNDLNLIRDKIPAALAAASKAPYAPPARQDCGAITDEVNELDAALGADLDTPASPDHPSLLDRGGDLAGDAAIGALRRTTESLIPFRGWVRKLTGAERHSKAVAAAITAGGIRRAYLKGLGQALRCPPPAAPLPPPPPPPPASAEPAKPADS